MQCDPQDRHVLAAAVRSRAGAIVTFNLSDFPDPAVGPYEIEVIHPDTFLLDLLDLAPDAVLAELERQARANRQSPKNLQELLHALTKVHVTQFAKEVGLLEAMKEAVAPYSLCGGTEHGNPVM